MPSKSKGSQPSSLTPAKSRKTSSRKRAQTQDTLNLSFNPSFNLNSMPIGSIKFSVASSKPPKESYNIVDSSLTKQGKIEYIGEG